MLTLRSLAPRTSFWRDAQFDTIRLSLIKIAARVTETVTRIKNRSASAFPYQVGFADLAGRIAKLPPSRRLPGCPSTNLRRNPQT
jgi:hypothetical protein